MAEGRRGALQGRRRGDGSAARNYSRGKQDAGGQGGLQEGQEAHRCLSKCWRKVEFPRRWRCQHSTIQGCAQLTVYDCPKHANDGICQRKEGSRNLGTAAGWRQDEGMGRQRSWWAGLI